MLYSVLTISDVKSFVFLRGVKINIAKSFVFLDIGGGILCKATAQSAHYSAMRNNLLP